MAKNTYESFEFLPANVDNADAGQFFVVEENGTFIINRPIQYVTQVQDVKQALGEVSASTVYDVESPQFYVDANNSLELISAPDQFIIPNGENNAYTSGYFLQPVTDEKQEEVEENIVEFNEISETSADINVEAENSDSKPTADFTERHSGRDIPDTTLHPECDTKLVNKYQYIL